MQSFRDDGVFDFTQEEKQLLNQFKPLYKDSKFAKMFMSFAPDTWDDPRYQKNFFLEQFKFDILICIYSGEFPQVATSDEIKLENFCRKVADFLKYIGDDPRSEGYPLLPYELSQASPVTSTLYNIHFQVKELAKSQNITLAINALNRHKVSHLICLSLEETEYRKDLISFELLRRGVDGTADELLSNIKQLHNLLGVDERISFQQIIDLYQAIPSQSSVYVASQESLYHFLQSQLIVAKTEEDKISILQQMMKCALITGNNELFTETLSNLCGLKNSKVLQGATPCDSIAKLASMVRNSKPVKANVISREGTLYQQRNLKKNNGKSNNNNNREYRK